MSSQCSRIGKDMLLLMYGKIEIKLNSKHSGFQSASHSKEMLWLNWTSRSALQILHNSVICARQKGTANTFRFISRKE